MVRSGKGVGGAEGIGGNQQEQHSVVQRSGKDSDSVQDVCQHPRVSDPADRALQ